MKGYAVIALLCLVVAGCGGGGGGGGGGGSGSGSGLYTRATTERCVKKIPGVKVDAKLDFVASTATGGAFHVASTLNAATVVFGKTIIDANNINAAYHRFRAKNVGIDDVIAQKRNVVMLFRVHPSDPLISGIEGCLSP